MNITDYREIAESLHLRSFYVNSFGHNLELAAFNAEYSKIAAAAREHFASQPRQSRAAGVNLWAIHPLCAEISLLKEPHEIMRLLDTLRATPYHRILASDATNYVLAEHRLAEEGIFDHLIITEAGGHTPVDSINEFRNARTNILGGCYRDFCVREMGDYLGARGFQDVRIGARISYTPPKIFITELWPSGTLG